MLQASQTEEFAEVRRTLTLPEGMMSRAFIQPTSSGALSELDELFFNMSEEEFVESMGLAALSILARDRTDVFDLVCIAIQALTLQFAFLYGMWLCVVPEEECEIDIAGKLPASLVCVAIYLHFMNSFIDIPFTVLVLMSFRHFRPGLTEACLTMPVFLADAVVVPVATMVVGALFLCTSESIEDVFLNSIACTFVSGIDNWILILSMKLKSIGGRSFGKGRVHIPYQDNVITVLDLTVSVIPVVPLLFTGSMAMLGLGSMGLPCPSGWQAE